MRRLTLLRVASDIHGTFGVLMDDDQMKIPFAVTLERPWLDNQPSVSCIPAGQYACQRVQSPKFGDTFEVQNVPNRTAILFHKGNITDDTHGCILVGEQFEPVNGVPGVLASAHGFDEFLRRLAGEPSFWLLVKWT